MKRFWWVQFIIFVWMILLLPGVSRAQSRSTCDACGYCLNNQTNVPGNWEVCAQCLYGTNDPEKTLTSEPDRNKSYTVFGCLQMGAACDTASDPDCVAKSGAANFANFFLSFFTTIVGGIAFLTMVFGGAKVMLAKGDPDAMREGKRYVYGAILGLVVVTMSVLIVKIIGGNLLQIPYLQ
jgi:hypothetical protein